MNKETHRWTNRQEIRKTDKHNNKQIGSYPFKQINRQSQIQADRQLDRHLSRKPDRQTDRQTTLQIS